MTHDHHSFSFAQSAESHGRKLKTDVIEAAIRFPIADVDHPFGRVEQEARAALGLDDSSKFIVIERARVLDGQPSAFHRAYLAPGRLPEGFLEHDFSSDSLVDLYAESGKKYGYAVESRDTVLSARGANVYEVNLIRQRYHSDSHNRVVLDAEQRLFARDSATGELFVLEFLKASYLEGWKYEIKNRPA